MHGGGPFYFYKSCIDVNNWSSRQRVSACMYFCVHVIVCVCVFMYGCFLLTEICFVSGVYILIWYFIFNSKVCKYALPQIRPFVLSHNLLKISTTFIQLLSPMVLTDCAISVFGTRFPVARALWYFCPLCPQISSWIIYYMIVLCDLKILPIITFFFSLSLSLPLSLSLSL